MGQKIKVLKLFPNLTNIRFKSHATIPVLTAQSNSILSLCLEQFHIRSHFTLPIALWYKKSKLGRRTFPVQGHLNVRSFFFLSHTLTSYPWGFERGHIHCRVESALLCLFKKGQHSDLFREGSHLPWLTSCF